MASRRFASPFCLAVFSFVVGIAPGVAPPARAVFAPPGAPALTAVQAVGRAAAEVRSRVTVSLPDEDAELRVQDQSIPGQGASRVFETPPLEAGRWYEYVFVAEWRPNGYTRLTRRKAVAFRAGDPVVVDLTQSDPSDRARVIYVPTPQEIADAMVRVAGIRPDDVVYEPGCGDARVLIAAVKAGARRGVGIDIDPERVAESRANVKAAGLEDRIEIRLGDALEQDYSEATVVLLYMGDEFNKLIRPLLWKQLRVGARVVSHRFTMGDWLPDKTVNASGYDEGPYEVHLWTITEAVKRRAAAR
jgi:uncharacterized protein (TIGR03000 family)